MSEQNTKSDLDSLLDSIDKQLLLRLLDTLIDEQGIASGSATSAG